MSIPFITLNRDALLPQARVTYVDLLIGAMGGHVMPMRTREDLEQALKRTREHLNEHADAVVGIIADRYNDGTFQVYTVVKRATGVMRVCIQKVRSDNLLIIDTQPLIKSQPHLLYTWGGIEGFARMWFDTLK